MNEAAGSLHALASAAVVDVADPLSGSTKHGADVVRVRGNDRIAFLHRMLTNSVDDLAPGAGTRALLLDVKGHIVCDMRVCVSGDEVKIVVAGGQGVAAAAALSRFAVMDDVTCEVATGEGPLFVAGPAAFSALERAGATGAAAFVDRPEGAHGTTGLAWLLRVVSMGGPAAWVFGDASARAVLKAALNLPVVTSALADAVRIAAGEPLWGSEITAERFPMEVGVGAAIDYHKGCFLGQEPIVRIRDRGHVNWRLVRLSLPASSPLPAVGDTLEVDGRPRAGRVTSAALHPGSGQAAAYPVALALAHASVPGESPVRIVTAGGAVLGRIHDLAP
jgi:folate-binding protein YgfZ